jgi:signal transduction histidine kinase/CheY-like chemotaxis protein
VNIATAVSVSAVVVGVLFGTLTLGFSSAPGWKELRWFALCAALASIYSACDVLVTIDVPPAVTTWAARACLFLGGLHALAWFAYVAAQEARPLTRLERGFVVIGLFFSGVAFVPGALVTDQVTSHLFMGIVYLDAIPTPLGVACFVFYSLGLLVLAVNYYRRWRRKVPAAGAHFAGLAIFLVAGVCDSVSTVGIVSLPMMLDVGFLGVVVAIGGAVTARFVLGARKLEELSNRLELAVEERTLALRHAQGALVQSNKLAAIGRLSAGVAHEINNPAAVVVANLNYVRDRLVRSGQPPADGRECIDESLAAMSRLTRIVRQLLDAGRTAGRPDAVIKVCNLADAARASAVTAGQALAKQVDVRLDVPSDLNALGEANLVEQVLVNLMVNAAQAIGETGRRGRIQVTAERQAEWVCVLVTDDGPGIPEQFRDRIFEPFFTTKAVGKGTGLGLAVSLGLVRALGGDLSVRSTSPAGTQMALLLPWTGKVEAAHPESAAAPARVRRRLLVVDDEQPVLEALRRELNAHFAVDVAAGVDAALARVSRSPQDFDLVLCDVMMPSGGGQRFALELHRIAPALAARTLFVTGGATSEAAQRFIEAQPGRVLEKPLNLNLLTAMAETVCGAGT